MTQYDTFTNKGTREINEDRCGVAMHEDSYCFTVADGLGGHGNGEIAAQAAVDAICTMFVDEGYSDSFFKKAFSAAQDAIVQQQERLQAPSRMKTTLVVLVIHKGKAVWAHVGDSRLYEFKQGKMKGRTIDHSVPQMLAISGEIEEKDIRHHLDRNRLMRVMGIQTWLDGCEAGNIRDTLCGGFALQIGVLCFQKLRVRALRRANIHQSPQKLPLAVRL